MEKQNKKVFSRRRKASVNDDDEEISLTTFLLFTRNLLIKKKLINYGSEAGKVFTVGIDKDLSRFFCYHNCWNTYEACGNCDNRA